MKRIIAIFIISITMFIHVQPLVSYAAEYLPTRTYFIPYRNEYRADYPLPQPYSFHYLRVDFITDNGSFYSTIPYTVATGTFYLTCNGTYWIRFFDENDEIIKESSPIRTTQITNPPCQSYPEQDGLDDLNADYFDNGNGTYNLTWDPLPNAAEYEIWQNGELVGTTTDPQFTIDGQGGVSIVAKDSNGDIIGQSDLQVPDWDEDDPNWNNDSSCGDICQKLSDLMNCPNWGDYMGEWENMLRDVIPPPPDWDEVSQTFVNAFAEYFGEVPDPPTQADLENLVPELPQLDTTTGSENLVPEVPPEFNQKIEFDLSDAPVIEIIDNSQPFEILDPLQGLDTLPVGVGAVPGDPNNHSGGIEDPEGVADLPIAIPEQTADPGDDLEYEHSDIPAYKNPTGNQDPDGSIPDPTIGDIPIPVYPPWEN